MDFEDILKEVGGFGFYQKRLLWLFLIPVAAFCPYFAMINLFFISSPDHWCRVPQLANLSLEEQFQLIRPPSNESLSGMDQCQMYDRDYDHVASHLHLYLTPNVTMATNVTVGASPVQPCQDWVFDSKYYDATAVTALNLICDRKHFAAMVLSMQGFGSTIGAPILSYLSDKIGRRKSFYLTVFIYIISTISPLFVRELYTFLTFRVINGLIMPAMYQIPYVMLLEVVGPQSRTLIGGVSGMTWTLGMCSLPFIVYLTRHWVILQVVGLLTSLIFFAYWKLLPESPRWLIVNKRYKDAADVVNEIARLNGYPAPERLEEKLAKVGKKLGEEVEEKVNPAKVLLTKKNIRKRFLLLTLNWIAQIIAYCGITYNLFNFHGNEFVNFFLMSVVEFPSYLAAWWMMETRLGRRWSNSFFLVLCGVALCVPAAVPSSWTLVVNGSTMVAKFGVAASFIIVYQQAAELYPTPLRNQGLGYGSMIASLVNIFLPYLSLLGVYGVWLPLTIMGTSSILAGFEATLLPETLNEVLPQTVEEAENFGKDQTFWSWAKTKPAASQDVNLKLMGAEKPDVIA